MMTTEKSLKVLDEVIEHAQVVMISLKIIFLNKAFPSLCALPYTFAKNSFIRSRPFARFSSDVA